MSTLIRGTAIGALAALSLGAGLATTATPAAARGWGAPVAAGIIGGLALGALAASAHAYYPPPAAYYPPSPGYYPACYLERRPVYDRRGDFLGWRPVRVCD